MNRMCFSGLLVLAVFIGLPGCSENSSGDYSGPPLFLEAPTDLRAAGKSSTLVQLRWEDHADEEEGYYIERSTDGADFETVGFVTNPAPPPSDYYYHTDSVPAPETPYYYRVYAAYDHGAPQEVTSDFSNIAVVIPLAGPEGLTAESPASTEIMLTWTDTSVHEDKFSVERAEVGVTNFEIITTVEKDRNWFLDEGLEIQTTYLYRVRAFDLGGNLSDYSDEQTESTLAVPWARSYGGVDYETSSFVCAHGKDGSILAGTTATYGVGSSDLHVLNLGVDGKIVWEKTYCGSLEEYARSVMPTCDGGYILAGDTTSFGKGLSNLWVLKLDADGGIEWEKCYGGDQYNHAACISETGDGGFILAGTTDSFGAGSRDVWILKLDGIGDVTWQKTYGGDDADYARQIALTADGGFIVAGRTSSFGSRPGDFWVFKLDSAGDVKWQKSYGQAADIETAFSIAETNDGEGYGYIVAGNRFIGGNSEADLWVLKLDGIGTPDWQKTYGGTKDDRLQSVFQAKDLSYIVAGHTRSFGAGGVDCWIMNVDSQGAIVWEKTFGGVLDDALKCCGMVPDGGYIAAADTLSFGAGFSDYWAFRLNLTEALEFIPTSGALVLDSTATVTDTAVVPADTTATVTDTMISPVTTSAVVTVTSCIVNEQAP